MPERVTLVAASTTEHVLQRFDSVAADLFPQYSRAVLQGWIKSGELTLDGDQVKPSRKLNGGEVLAIDAEVTSVELHAETMELAIVYEDTDLLVVNKAAGLVVHPGAGNKRGTLLNGLLAHDEELASLPRAGLVHRLDKDTTGLMVVAKGRQAYYGLIEQLSERTVSRVYEAIVYGEVPPEGRIDSPIGRHRTQRTKMAITSRGREAITHYRLRERLGKYSHVSVRLETGRTHQIRVHMQHIGFPLVGDPVYGRKTGPEFQRQALHARRLSFTHPVTGKQLRFQQPLPDDFEDLLNELRDAAV
tara:strand:+ start:777 stop:1685 length:909 start_codon:yes stop_codon:yes gene_type:complete